jgi:GAF domain-containing protein
MHTRGVCSTFRPTGPTHAVAGPAGREDQASVTGPADQRMPEQPWSAFDELGLLVLEDQSTQTVLQKVVDLVQRVMPPGVEASITLLREERPTTAAFTGERALALDEMQYDRGYGPCLEAAIGGAVVEILDGHAEDRWPAYIPTFLDHGAVSALAVPVPAAQLSAALNLYAPVAEAFSEEDKRTAQDFAARAAVALTNLDVLQDARDLAENLQAALESRSVIEQAKGILIERHKMTADQAFRLLAEASMRTNRKLRDIAERLVLTGELGV